MPYGQVDRLCKLVPADPANPVTLAKAVEGEPRFEEARKQEPVVDRLLTIAMKLEGLYRHASTHAAGIVIGDRPLDELVPLYRDPRSPLPVTQFNMKWVEQAGLVKFDFLGLKTLTVLEKAVELIRRRGIEHRPCLDPARRRADLRDAGARRDGRHLPGGRSGHAPRAGRHAARPLRGPDRARRALPARARWPTSRSIARASSARRRPTTSIRSSSRSSKATYGVITYQEQVMQIARDLAGYSLGEADLLRRAMGKKIRSEMEKQRERFISGAVERGIAHADAVAIFDACAKFADYGFNKSHSAPYALITYQTAYLKANYPVEFLAASMTLDMNNTDKLNEFRLEARRLGIEVVAPDVNRSGVAFEAVDGKIVYALAALKGVGTHAVEHLVAGARRNALRRPRRFRAAHRSADRQPQGARMPGAGRRLRRLEPERAKLFENIGTHPRRRAGAERADARAASPTSSADQRRADAALPRRGRSVVAVGAAAARVRRGRHVSQRPSDRRLCGADRDARRPHLEGVPRAAPHATASSPA